MKKVLVIAVAAALAAAAYGEWVFASKWGGPGTGNGEFRSPFRLAVAAYDNVYVADWGNLNVQYFTHAGSFLGKWDQRSRSTPAGEAGTCTYYATYLGRS